MSSYKYILPDDVIIIEQIRKHNKFFEDLLYIKYRDILFEYGNSRCNNNEKNLDIIQDLIQDTMIVTIERIRVGEFISNKEEHVLNSMKRTFKNLLSNWRRYKKKSLPLSVPIPDFLIEDEEETPYVEILKECLNVLDEKCKNIIVSFYYESFSMNDIAEKFSFISTERNARQFKYRCIKKLKNNAKRLLSNYIS